MSKIDDLAKEVAAEFRATGRRLSVQTVEEFLALVRPYYVALDPPAPPRAGMVVLPRPVAEAQPLSATAIESAMDKLGL